MPEQADYFEQSRILLSPRAQEKGSLDPVLLAALVTAVIYSVKSNVTE